MQIISLSKFIVPRNNRGGKTFISKTALLDPDNRHMHSGGADCFRGLYLRVGGEGPDARVRLHGYKDI